LSPLWAWLSIFGSRILHALLGCDHHGTDRVDHDVCRWQEAMRVHDAFAFRGALFGAVVLSFTAFVQWRTEQQKVLSPRSFFLFWWTAFWAAVCWFDAWKYR